MDRRRFRDIGQREANAVTRYLLSRTAQALLVLMGAYTIAYLILYLLPGDPLAILLNAAGRDIDALSPAEIAEARIFYGLDGTPLERYFELLWNALHGDFGFSASKNAPVAQLILERLPQTLALGGLAVVFSIVEGVGFGYLAASVRSPALGRFLARLPAFGVSLPSFWLGLLLIHLFAFTLGWLPAAGNDGFRSLILPAFTLSIYSAAIYAQLLIRGLEAVSREPFIVTAHAKGLTRGEVQFRHAFRNAALPIVTLVGLQIGNTFSGAVLIETVFTRTGVGRLAEEAVLRQDIPVVLAVVTLSAAGFVFVNLLIDLLYPILDPRIVHAPKG